MPRPEDALDAKDVERAVGLVEELHELHETGRIEEARAVYKLVVAAEQAGLRPPVWTRRAVMTIWLPGVSSPTTCSCGARRRWRSFGGGATPGTSTQTRRPRSSCCVRSCLANPPRVPKVFWSDVAKAILDDLSPDVRPARAQLE